MYKKNEIKENETTLFAYIWETTNTNRQRFLTGMGHEEGSENKLNLWTESFIPSVTTVASLYGVLCTMYHRMQKAPICCRGTEPGPRVVATCWEDWNRLHNQQNWGNETIANCEHSTQRGRFLAKREHRVTLRLTFHLFPHWLQKTNVVIGSSALRVWTWNSHNIRWF